MSLSGLLTCLALALAFAFALPCGGEPGEVGDRDPHWRAIDHALRELQREGAPAPAKLVDAMLPHAQRCVPELFGVLESRRVPALGGEPSQPLNRAQEQLSLGALAGLDRQRVLADLATWLGARPAAAQRAAALSVVGSVGSHADALLLCSLVGDPEDEVSWPALSAALEEATTALVTREPGAAALFGEQIDALPDSVLSSLVLGVGRTNDPRVLRFLCDVLVWRPGHEIEVAAQVRRLGRSGDEQLDADLADALRGELLDDLSELRQAAMLALAELRDENAIDALLERLETAESGERTDAHSALTRIVGVSLPADARAWRAWLESERAWFENDFRAARQHLLSGSPAQRAAALREIGQRRLRRPELAEAVLEALDRMRPSLAVLACGTLGDLACAFAAPELERLAVRDDGEVAVAARAALARIDALR